MKSILEKKKSNLATEKANEDLNIANDDKYGTLEEQVTSPSVVLNERYLLDKEDEDEEVLSNILDQMQSFSIEWKSLKGISQCSCGSPIDYLTRKVSKINIQFDTLKDYLLNHSHVT